MTARPMITSSKLSDLEEVAYLPSEAKQTQNNLTTARQIKKKTLKNF